jgi:hypothetical protein
MPAPARSPATRIIDQAGAAVATRPSGRVHHAICPCLAQPCGGAVVAGSATPRFGCTSCGLSSFGWSSCVHPSRLEAGRRQTVFASRTGSGRRRGILVGRRTRSGGVQPGSAQQTASRRRPARVDSLAAHHTTCVRAGDFSRPSGAASPIDQPRQLGNCTRSGRTRVSSQVNKVIRCPVARGMTSTAGPWMAAQSTYLA